MEGPCNPCMSLLIFTWHTRQPTNQLLTLASGAPLAARWRVRVACLQYVLPTDSPHLARSAFALALSPVLWAQHKPDRFDSWSAGMVMLQLCLPPLRTPRGLNLFKTEFERADYDLEAWRSSCRWISKRDTAVLDGNDGAGESQLGHQSSRINSEAEQ